MITQIMQMRLRIRDRAQLGCHAPFRTRKPKLVEALRYFAVVSVLLWAMEMRVGAATITVTNRSDSGAGSLRQALTTANDGDTINFAVTGTITLTSGGLPINKNITVSGPSPDQLSVDGGQALLVFGIFPDKTAAISGITVRNGQTGIWNEEGTLAVNKCTVTGNSEGLYNDLER